MQPPLLSMGAALAEAIAPDLASDVRRHAFIGGKEVEQTAYVLVLGPDRRALGVGCLRVALVLVIVVETEVGGVEVELLVRQRIDS